MPTAQVEKKTRIFARILMRAKIQTKKLSPYPARRFLPGKYLLRDAGNIP